MKSSVSFRVAFVVCIALATVITAPAEAQGVYKPLFDKFNLRLDASWLGLSTEVRLDSEVLGRGTTLNFEDDLNLERNQSIPSLSFEWQVGRRHRLGVRWQDINRDSTSQTLTDIQWGDETIPIDALITLGFDLTQFYVDYTYYPWVKERWAAGFGLGLRVMEISATLGWNLDDGENLGEGSTDVAGTGPLPYLYFEYRRLLSDHWRFHAGLGWLYVSIEDISGGQYIGRLGIEYLAGRRWGFGAAVSASVIEVDWNAIDTDEHGSLLNLALENRINDFSVFVRVRF